MTDSTGDYQGYSFGDARYAIYAVPPLGSPLKTFGDAWLGRDPDIDEPMPHPTIEGFDAERLREITASPRHYGFHATLKAPFGLAEGAEAATLVDALTTFVAGREPIDVRLKVASLGDFIALVPAEPVPAIDALAADCVRDFEPFRAPLTPEDREARCPERLTARQREYLDRWGYHLVFEEFTFHMTLTGSVDEPEHGRIRGLLERLMEPALREPLRIDQIALFTQTHRVAPFRVVDRYRFGR